VARSALAKCRGISSKGRRWEDELKAAEVLALAFSLLTVAVADVDATETPWCAPKSVEMRFSDQQGRQAVRLELFSAGRRCIIRYQEEAVGLYQEPAIHIDFYGKALNVPASCLTNFSFRPSDIVVTIGDTGVGIQIPGKSPDGSKRMQASIYTANDEVHCSEPHERCKLPDEFCGQSAE
jgi:hypothetical protein